MLAAAMAAWSATARAQASKSPFDQWVAAFRARARARGISDATYTRVMGSIKPDIAVFELNRFQPNSTNNSGNISIAASPIGASRPARRKRRNTRRFWAGSRRTTASTAGSCSGYGDRIRVRRSGCAEEPYAPGRPGARGAAVGEPRRRAYWEQELLNALVIIERGWSTSEEMRGSWAGAMGHTQWMRSVAQCRARLRWRWTGEPFGKPDDALAGTAQYLVRRGRYRPGSTGVMSGGRGPHER